MKNQIAKARDEFFTGVGAQLLQGEVSGKFLKNRLEAAFIAGYQAAELNLADFAMEKIKQLMREAIDS